MLTCKMCGAAIHPDDSDRWIAVLICLDDSLEIVGGYLNDPDALDYLADLYGDAIVGFVGSPPCLDRALAKILDYREAKLLERHKWN